VYDIPICGFWFIKNGDLKTVTKCIRKKGIKFIIYQKAVYIKTNLYIFFGCCCIFRVISRKKLRFYV